AAGEGWGGANDGVAASAPSVPPHPGLPPQAGEGEEQSARIASREVLHNPDRCLTQVKVNRSPPADDFADLYRRLPQHGFDTQAMDRTGTPVDQFIRRAAVGGQRGAPPGAADARAGAV